MNDGKRIYAGEHTGSPLRMRARHASPLHLAVLFLSYFMSTIRLDSEYVPAVRRQRYTPLAKSPASHVTV